MIFSIIDRFRHSFKIDDTDFKIITQSDLPPQRGLKTSSAISCLTIEILAKYFDIDLSTRKIIELSAETSVSAGVSITGAIDDAYASYCGGLSYTNNEKLELIKHVEQNGISNVYLIIPEQATPKSSIGKNIGDINRRLLQKAREMLLNNNLLSAIEYNTMAYGPFLLQDYQHIQTKMKKEELIWGLNGAGPSLFVVDQHKNLDRNYISSLFPSSVIYTTKYRPIQKEVK